MLNKQLKGNQASNTSLGTDDLRVGRLTAEDQVYKSNKMRFRLDHYLEPSDL